MACITLSSYPTGNKQKLDFAPGTEDYHAVHKKYYSTGNTSYYDLFLFDLDGNLIYYVDKKMDYATNFAAQFCMRPFAMMSGTMIASG